jgi:NADH-quinone oxidoreductase subunit J
MNFELIAFYIFAAVAVMAALGVILYKNPVHAALSLVLTFFNVACLWLLLQAEFLGVALILVYVGAVMILFLFVVMMLDINTTPMREGLARYFPVAALVAIVMGAEMIGLMGVTSGARSAELGPVDPASATGYTNVEWIARSLFTTHMLSFEIAAVVLTIAIVIAVMLTLRRRENTKHQDVTRQVNTRRADRIRLVKMPAETKQQEPQE